MGSIKRLPETIRNTMRSGVILFDLTRVVEELVFNSLDAAATKVSVYVGVGTCCVKVVDDGCGMSRDGLVLLGERYVTSKLHHLADMDAANGSFGFRGEALASISDVSLLEIVTKARGRPNGYSKVLKGSKCLYLGVNDDRKDVGTTVVVRDLFYNQPVRRKYMQSSPKKVLDSVKKCVFRIALVHSEVSFKVVDSESEDELLCTHPSSALSLLMSSFGIEDSSFLCELHTSRGLLKLSGYMSGPRVGSTMKALQYVYVNSRFVCKGPVHKLINHLATRVQCLDPWQANCMSQKGKRCKPQACPAYILNLSCPSALYDLTFEPSKTYVEFKDWIPILNFFENSIEQHWREDMTYEFLHHSTSLCKTDEIWRKDLSKTPEFATNKCEIQSHKSSHLLASHFKIPTKETGHIYSGESDKFPFQEFSMDISEFKEQESDLEFSLHGDFSSGSLYKHVSTVTQKSDNHLMTSDDNSLSPDYYFLEDRFTARERSSDYEEVNILGLEQQNEFRTMTSFEINESSGSAFSFHYHKFSDELEASKLNEEPFLKSCSSRGSLPFDKSLFSSEEGPEFPFDGFNTKRRRVCIDEDVNILQVDASNRRNDLFVETFPQLGASCSQKFHAHRMGVQMPTDFDSLSEPSAKSFSSHAKLFAEEKDIVSASLVPTDTSTSCYRSLNSEWCSLTSDDSLQASSWAVEHFPDDNSHEGSARLGKRANHCPFADSRGSDGNYFYKMASKSSGIDNFVSSYASTLLDFNGYSDATKNIRKFPQGHNVNEELSVEHSDLSTCGTDWFAVDLHSRGHKGDKQYRAEENEFRCQDWEHDNFPEERARRSKSAPPFFNDKRRFISKCDHSMMKDGNARWFRDGLAFPETDGLKHLKCHPNYAEDIMFRTRPNVNDVQDIMLDLKETKEGLIAKETEYSTEYGTKWRNGYQQIVVEYLSQILKKNNTPNNIDNQQNILNISSGFLHLAGNSLIPESFHKNFFDDAKVLQQVDKKFIPIVAGGTLAVIDQHAADERIQLEELRQKVMSGEAKTMTYLDAEKELTLPEMGYQLLHTYSEQVRDWGWICNIEPQGSGSFKKKLNILHQQPTAVTLLAVPCILGVNLSDGDLLEFLQQLADTDGSSTMPPSVLRVLNLKACRGAIMFGDFLQPSECALIVEELKRTSLCFQCAHGRPTTVPLVNLEELHKQIAKVGMPNDGSSELWHGLRRQELSYERAAQRLSRARG